MSTDFRRKFVDLQASTAPLREELLAACRRVIDSGWFLRGPETEAFERELARSCGAEYAVAVSNGLDALRLTLRAWKLSGKLSDGDEVIVAANTYVASVLAITDAGLKPRLVEPDGLTHNLSAESVGKALSARTRAIMEVHLYGLPCPHTEIEKIAAGNDLLIIEDNAQAIGASVQGRHTGALGTAAAFSFYPTKNVGALGDAGAVTTSCRELADAVRALANYGSDRRYHNIYAGFNCRMDEMQAAMLRVKLRYLRQETAARDAVARAYSGTISNQLVIKPIVPNGHTHVWHQYVIRTRHREQLRTYLLSHGIPTDIHYATPPHLQPCYQGVFTGNYPLAERLAREVVSLPIAGLTPDEAKEIALIINSFTPVKGK